jgi:PAS domain S-box-containing protein
MSGADHTETDKELLEAKQRLDLALSESGAGVWEWNIETDALYWSDELLELLGLSRGEFDGSIAAFETRLHPDDAERVEEQIQHAIETGKPYRSEQRIKTENGDYRWLDVRGQLTDDGITMIGVAFDITRHKQRERRLARQNDRLDKFASVACHDLRNPLHVAKGNLSLAQEDNDSEHLQQIDTALERMDTLIEDLLTLARSGQDIEDSDFVPLADVARYAWTTTDINNCFFESSVPDSLRLRADRERLLQIFENLYRNAADHNDPPLTICVGTLEQPRGNTAGEPTGFFIEDTGSGIPQTKRESIFEHGYTTSEDGTGFGLSIVRDIVDAHGWRIKVTEGADGGARFEIRGIEIDQ